MSEHDETDKERQARLAGYDELIKEDRMNPGPPAAAALSTHYGTPASPRHRDPHVAKAEAEAAKKAAEEKAAAAAGPGGGRKGKRGKKSKRRSGKKSKRGKKSKKSKKRSGKKRSGKKNKTKKY